MLGNVTGVCALCLASTAQLSPTDVSLQDVALVVGPGQPSSVQYHVEELRAWLSELGGHTRVVETLPEQDGGVLVCIGPDIARQVPGAVIDETALGPEGYVLEALPWAGRTCLIVSGATPRGTQFGIGRLMRMVRVDGDAPRVSLPERVVSRPSFSRRGMHFNGWPFGYPYTFRRWSESDWQHYIDLLSLQGINLLYLWPFMEILPVPLSANDEAYLREYRRLVEYAQTRHGMEVWIMQSPNRVACGDAGDPDPRSRPYWRMEVQQDLNPGDPEQFRRIMASREALYRIIDNVDGVCTIDSDPGWCEGSPVSDYVRILKGCRELLDRYNVHGRETRLIHWMWCGWGHAREDYFRADKQVETIRAIREGLPEPWLLVAGMEGFLPLCRQEGVTAKTVLLRYGAIEDEPSYPATNFGVEHVRTVFECLDANTDLAGVMGNLQTPLLQFPLECLVSGLAWDVRSRTRSAEGVAGEVAEALYPDCKDVVARALLALRSNDAASVGAVADELAGIVERRNLGRPGVYGRKLFPAPDLVAVALVAQLRLRAAQERLVAAATSHADRQALVEALGAYCAPYLAWDLMHGWHDYWDRTQGWGHGWLLGRLSVDERFPVMLEGIRQALGGTPLQEQAVRAFLAEATRGLDARYGAKAVATYIVDPLAKVLLEPEPPR